MTPTATYGRRAAGLLLAAAALAGCTGEGGPAPTPVPELSDGQPGTAETGGGRIDDVPQLAPGWAGVRKDVTLAQCPTTAGEVTAGGTVANTADGPRDIVIVVSWNAPGTTDPLLRLVATADGLPAGQSTDWTVTGTLPADSGECVLSAKSGELP